MSEKTLIMFVGLPRSGKSTQARAMARINGWPIVNKDAIRLALHGQRFQPEAEDMVHAISKTMASALFIAGHDTVILDECNVSEKRRKEWMNGDWKVLYHYVDTPKEVCLERAATTNDTVIVPVIERMAGEFDFVPVEGAMI